jgi:uncharacterized membrane protein
MPAIIFYLLFVASVVVFVVVPAIERGSLGRALLLGGSFGLVTYATYDLTNLATMRGFPNVVAAVDMTWGWVLSAVVAAVGYVFAARAKLVEKIIEVPNSLASSNARSVPRDRGRRDLLS